MVSSITFIDFRNSEEVYHISLLPPLVNSLFFPAISKTGQYIYNRKQNIILCKESVDSLPMMFQIQYHFNWPTYSNRKILKSPARPPCGCTTSINEPLHEKPNVLHMQKTKTQVSFAVIAKLISAFVFVTRIV